MLDKLRNPVSGLIHLGAAIAAAVGMAVLMFFGHNSATKEVSLLVYGLSLILMFATSSAYHLIKSQPHVTMRFRKLDHSAIYLLIAGTYTPICLHFFNGFWQWGLLGIVWLMATVGIATNAFITKAPRWLTAGISLMMGWLSLVAIREIFITMPMPALVWLSLGGLFFTVGAVVYITKKPDFYPGVFGFHEVWHIFVILGCACHFILVFAYIASYAGAA